MAGSSTPKQLAMAGLLAVGMAMSDVAPAQSAPAGAASATAGDVPVLAVVPAAMASDMAFGNGCWVRLFDGVDYRGEQLALVGPLALPSMKRASPWWRRWNSAVVGPRARMQIHSAEDFRQNSATLVPGQRASDLAAPKVGWFNQIGSVQITCVSG